MCPEESKSEIFKQLHVGITENLQEQLKRTQIEGHPTSRGDSAEEAWRTCFKNYFPSRFSIGAGTVIDAHGGRSKQIDCIVYDNVFTPKFYGKDKRLHIPAESVHAIFEIKQKVNKKYIRDASGKIASVRRLHRTSASYIVDGKERHPKEQIFIIGGLLATKTVYRDGIKASKFDEAMNEIQKEDPKMKGIDIILTADDGYADYFRAGYPADMYKDQMKGAAARGLFRLVRALLLQGTVSAIDLDYYHKKALL